MPDDIPPIFVSHSHEDNVYCRDFVAALRRALGSDDAVWYDEHNLGWGKIRRTIEHELERRQHFIAILSPAAVASDWVDDEIEAARGLLREGKMLTVSFVTAVKCDVPLLLRGYKRIEVAGGDGYPPAEAAAKVLAIVQPFRDEPPQAAHGAVPSQRVQPSTPPRQPALPRERFPERLERLGFAADLATDPQTGKEVAFILPPVCRVEAGPFRMGSNDSADYQAQPAHDVTLPAFAIGTFPVTVAEYACFVTSGHAAPGNWSTQQAKREHPVVNVSWRDATAYAAWLARLTGQPWKLPSEAEWEKAARWDPQRRLARIYPWGDQWDAARANTSESGTRGTTPVGSYPGGASPCGGQEMAGNVWEWTSSLYQPYPYTLSDGCEDRNSTGNRVLRGGSWLGDSSDARAACRVYYRPGDVYVDIGFCLVLSAAPSSAPF